MLVVNFFVEEDFEFFLIEVGRLDWGKLVFVWERNILSIKLYKRLK